MYWEINVSRLASDGKQYFHYFATAERSITSSYELSVIYNDLKNKFREPTYKINVTRFEKTGYNVPVNHIVPMERDDVRSS